MRRNVPKVLVVVTDGRSQDDVKKSAEKLQHSGIHDAVAWASAPIDFMLQQKHILTSLKFLFLFFTKALLPEHDTDLINSFY